MEWQPIETARKDDEAPEMFGYSPGHGIAHIWWDDMNDAWMMHGAGWVTDLTHWMPEPPPPTA